MAARTKSPGRYILTYTVSGKGSFPVDMLRYENAFPLSAGDVATALQGRRGRQSARSVRVVQFIDTLKRKPVYGRWDSFGWSVSDESVSREKPTQAHLEGASALRDQVYTAMKFRNPVGLAALLSNPGQVERFTPEAVHMLADAAERGWVIITDADQEDPAGELYDKGYVDWRLDVDGNEAIVLTRKGKERIAAALNLLAEERGRSGASLWADTLLNPSEAEGAGLGAGAGALLLGPLGALAGGYFGAKATRKKKKSKKNPKGRRWKGLSPIQRKVYDYIKVVEGPGEIDHDALVQVQAMGERGAQAYWKVKLEPSAREAAAAASDFVAEGRARRKKKSKKNPSHTKKKRSSAMRRLLRGT